MMRVFVSWSGEQTKALAHALKRFLDTAFAGHVSTFMSDADLAPGVRFLTAISANLDAADLGLLLVTKANQHAPWLLFEAGALAGKSRDGSVIPILVDLDRSDLISPLDQFQNVLSTAPRDFQKLFSRIRADAEIGPNGRALEILFDAEWPALAEALLAAAAEGSDRPVEPRAAEDVLAEILLGVNALVRRQAADMPSIHLIDTEWTPSPSADPPIARLADNKFDLFPGQVIVHDQFGRGEVEAVTGEYPKTVAHVNFASVGPKKILVRIAPISLLF